MHHLVQLVILGDGYKIGIPGWHLLFLSLITVDHPEIPGGLLHADTFGLNYLGTLGTLIGIFLTNVHVDILLPGHVLVIHYGLLILLGIQYPITVCFRPSVARGGSLLFNYHFGS
jgi:hypothetical protein